MTHSNTQIVKAEEAFDGKIITVASPLHECVEIRQLPWVPFSRAHSEITYRTNGEDITRRLANNFEQLVAGVQVAGQELQPQQLISLRPEFSIGYVKRLAKAYGRELRHLTS